MGGIEREGRREGREGGKEGKGREGERDEKRIYHATIAQGHVVFKRERERERERERDPILFFLHVNSLKLFRLLWHSLHNTLLLLD